MPRKAKHAEEELFDEEPPTSIDPYAVLGVDKDATPDKIKSAYRKAALKHHPDKAQDKEDAHVKFQEIAFAYAILSDERRRSRYDRTGRTDESVDIEDDDFNWADFYKAQFEDVVNEAAIDKFKNEYKGSDEEKGDLIAAYNKFEGNMNKIYQVVMLSNPLEDEDRFRGILDATIEDGTITSHKKYAEESEASIERRKKYARKEKKAAEKYGNELNEKKKSKKAKGDGDLGDLAALIQQRQKGRASTFLDNLEAKYAPKKRSTPMDEPSEEAFQRTASRAKKGKK
ncbi:uncharacterized protein K452DRAFT_312257 [Aplosporella prunicola CBS 121167]|uniref:J domain-containing protein n=1 Tax=Aplosporella prunicola CBS 121167 TaxID=1176127 RepID=A0A6A6B2Q4_9PEZI|nr:uncharacterized protein K452DRAFT_312257 [Aplosporella prunicola CBS 121167]KAF2137663.1 hypothetical protein K452DRAFT_312257 [Aplosporella prunicola CBS 121167]